MGFTERLRYLYITLLYDQGFQVFDTQQLKMVRMVAADKKKQHMGFVEGLFIPSHDCYFVSQMNTNTIFEYSTGPDPVLKRRFPSGGLWPKVIAYSPGLDLLAVSNWDSDNVTIIDYAKGNVIRSLDNLATPRGVAFTPDNSSLIIASYDGGFIRKYSTISWKIEGTIRQQHSCMRHVIISGDGSLAWISDMWTGRVFEIDIATFSIRHIFPTFHKPNTIAVSMDEHFLFVSCRGPNNPESYLYRSPENGRILVYDLLTRELWTTIYGGNQCTGLDVSSDGRYLAFSNFKDDNFELYALISASQPSP